MIGRVLREQRRGLAVGGALGALLVLGGRDGAGVTARLVDLSRALWRQLV